MENGQDKKLFAKKYRVASARLQGFDYASGGVYFITICTKDKRHFFGTIRDGEMQRSSMGHIVAAEWKQTATIRKNVALGAWVVMPNHFHAIVIIQKRHGSGIVETPRWGVSPDRKQAGIRCQENPGTFQWENPETLCGKSAETPHRGVSTGEAILMRNPHHHAEWKSGSLGSILNQFKSKCTKRIHAAGLSDFAWKSRFHDRIVRSEEEWRRIGDYIASNPKTWETDCNFSES